jgi:precorrin-2 dehydrogenase / sirohydrochlorin ferrochelatase
MRYYPVCLDLKDRPVLVVGGGAIAEGKAAQLVEAGARVHVVSPELTARLAELVAAGTITHERREFDEVDLEGRVLVISATDRQAVNEAVARAAAGRGLLCNVVDQPALCNFITPAVVQRGDLQISVSTAGSSPSVAQRVKREVGALIGPEYGELIELAAELRGEVRKHFATFDERREVMKAFAESEALELLRAGKREEARRVGLELMIRAVAAATKA